LREKSEFPAALCVSVPAAPAIGPGHIRTASFNVVPE
jgi:hypothetical protein